VGLRPDEVDEFFQLLPNPGTSGPGVYSASNRYEYQKQKNVSEEHSMESAQD
jgi:hypothetical protein